MSNETIVIDAPEGIRMYDVLSFRGALGLEIRTGMVMRPGFSIVQAAIKRGYVAEGTRRKRDAYAQLDALIVANGGPSSRPLPAE